MSHQESTIWQFFLKNSCPAPPLEKFLSAAPDRCIEDRRRKTNENVILLMTMRRRKSNLDAANLDAKRRKGENVASNLDASILDKLFLFFYNKIIFFLKKN